jgi:HK97 family phage portal protein
MSENAAADFKMFDLRGIDWPEVSSSRTPSGIRVNADNSMACSAYTACIRVISDAVSALPLHVYERMANGGKQKATSHPVYRLLHQQPNPWQTAQEFRDWMTGMYLHFGASYAEIRPGARGAVSELWPLHSSRMEAERLTDGTLRYRYREPSGQQTIYSQEQIFALRFTTEDGIKAIPTYKIFQNAIGLAQALEAHGSTYFGNGARPGIVLESDNPIPAEAAERLREQWERMHRGADRAFRTAVLPNGVKAHELSGSNEAAQMLESRAFQVVEICRAFRVPPHMIQMLDRSTFNNIEVQGTEFVQHCLLPHLKRWEAAISRDLIVDDERYFAEHSVSGLLRGDHREIETAGRHVGAGLVDQKTKVLVLRQPSAPERLPESARRREQARRAPPSRAPGEQCSPSRKGFRATPAQHLPPLDDARAENPSGHSPDLDVAKLRRLDGAALASQR